MINSFKDFLFESESELEKGLKVLNAKSNIEYYFLEIPDLPKNLKSAHFIYIVSTKEYGVCDEVTNLSGLKIPGEPFVRYKNPKDLLAFIDLIKLEEKGLSEEAYMWLEEELMSSSWDEAVKSLIRSGKMKDKDFEIMGLDKEKFRGTIIGAKYNI